MPFLPQRGIISSEAFLASFNAQSATSAGTGNQTIALTPAKGFTIVIASIHISCAADSVLTVTFGSEVVWQLDLLTANSPYVFQFDSVFLGGTLTSIIANGNKFSGQAVSVAVVGAGANKLNVSYLQFQ